MPELSKFNVLPFIAHKNMSLPQCALEKVKNVPFLFFSFMLFFTRMHNEVIEAASDALLFSVLDCAAERFEFNGESENCSSFHGSE